MNDDKLTIATRGSALALWQAHHVKARLEAIAPERRVELLVIKTSGDRIQDVPLAQVGGKGLFVKEIEQALLEGLADLAVHSMKDVPPDLADGLATAAVSARETPWDALCAREPVTIDTLAHGATVGTSSMRRQCQLLARRPDLKIEMLRGNVPTRIGRLDEGKFDAIVLAAAGLHRLGLADRITQLIPLELSIPAVAQGVLAIETRTGDAIVRELVVRAIHDAHTAESVAAERGFLARMGGSCQTPLAAHALDRDDGGMRLVGMVGLPDGTRILHAELGGARDQAQLMGHKLAEDLLAQGAEAILAATR
ncbi:MAG TPA: hydroxymethylbilane synthase [Kofleriaceae bacterium]|nr:hydroxymethylbilane synthase [Kofleriaceae bacterium]